MCESNHVRLNPLCQSFVRAASSGLDASQFRRFGVGIVWRMLCVPHCRSLKTAQPRPTDVTRFVLSPLPSSLAGFSLLVKKMDCIPSNCIVRLQQSCRSHSAPWSYLENPTGVYFQSDAYYMFFFEFAPQFEMFRIQVALISLGVIYRDQYVPSIFWPHSSHF